MSHTGIEDPAADLPSDDPDIDTETRLQAELELLTEENRRLRQETIRAHQTAYRRTAQGLAAVGALAVIAAVALPIVRTTLLVIGAIGLFGSVLTYYLTPERFVAAETGDRIVAAMDRSLLELTSTLDLAEQRLLVPTPGPDPIRLYVPIHPIDHPTPETLPERATLTDPVVTDDTGARGLALVPAGTDLYEVFEQRTGESPGESLTARAEQLSDALVEQFELATGAETDASPADGSLSIRFQNPAYGGADRFEDPLASFVGVGLAAFLEQPISMQAETSDDDRIVHFDWETDTQSATNG